MSAWIEIVNKDGSDEWLRICNAALTEVQAEQSRRNAKKIRDFSWESGCISGCCDDERGAEKAADLIDPDEESHV